MFLPVQVKGVQKKGFTDKWGYIRLPNKEYLSCIAVPIAVEVSYVEDVGVHSLLNSLPVAAAVPMQQLVVRFKDELAPTVIDLHVVIHDALSFTEEALIPIIRVGTECVWNVKTEV